MRHQLQLSWISIGTLSLFASNVMQAQTDSRPNSDFGR